MLFLDVLVTSTVISMFQPARANFQLFRAARAQRAEERAPSRVLSQAIIMSLGVSEIQVPV